ncbi:MAG: MmgE/PrpD family protein [Rhodospirillales bacterium]
MTGKDSLTKHVAEFTAETGFDDIPADVHELGKKNMLDGIAAGMAGSAAPALAILRDYLTGLGCPGTATVFGSPLTLAPRFAALANGTAIHVDDFDDTMQAEVGRFQGIHPTGPVTAALLAVGAGAHRSGRDILTAYQVGVEVACKTFEATHVNHILNGFHSTGTCGMLGAAAAVANLYGVDTENTRQAIGIAAAQACGLQANFGTMMKSYHVGRSAECGILSADLAVKGFTASPISLESDRGFFQAQGGGLEEHRIRGKLGNPWSFADRGIWIKPWPTGSLAHAAMTLMVELVEKHDLSLENVERIAAKTSDNIHHTLLHHHPKTELEAKFSLEFCLAALLVNRKLTLSDFSDEFVLRPDIQEAIAKIEYNTFSQAESREKGYGIITAFIDIDLKDGRRISERRDFGKGSKANPMSLAEVSEKFRDCAAFAGWPKGKTETAIELVSTLEDVPDIAALTAALGGE